MWRRPRLADLRAHAAELAVLAALVSLAGFLRWRRFGLMDVFEDGFHHWWIAAHFAETGVYLDPMSLMTRGNWLPGYYPLGALAYDVLGWAALDALRWMSLLASLATLVLVFRIAGRRGLLAATLAGLFYALVIEDALIASMALPESLAVFFVALAAYLVIHDERAAERPRAIGASLLLLAAVSLRYEPWVAVALLPVWAWRVRPPFLRTSLWIVAPSVLFGAAWTAVLLPQGALPAVVLGQTAREAQNQIAIGNLAGDPAARLWSFWYGNYAIGLLPMFLLGPAYMILRQRREYATWLAVALFFGVSVLVAAELGTGSYRYLAIAAPFLAASAGKGGAALVRRAPRLVLRSRASPRASRVVAAAAVVALVVVSAANTAWITPRLDGLGQLNDPLRRAGEWIATHPMAPDHELLSDSPIATYYSHVDPAMARSSWWLPANRTDALGALRAAYGYVVFVNVSYYPLRVLFPELAGGHDTRDFALAYDANGWERQYGAREVYVYAVLP